MVGQCGFEVCAARRKGLSETPKTKIQTPNKSQTPNPKPSHRASRPKRRVRLLPVEFITGAAKALTYFFNTSPTNSNKAFVGGPSGRPRLSLSLLWLVS